MKVLFCGGGTLGPVTPLLAVLRKMRAQDPKLQFAWVGTSNGPEAGLVEAEGVSFHAIPSAKLPRYLSLDLLKFPFRYHEAKKMTQEILAQEKPALVVTVGGFSGVPVIKAAAALGIPCALHQLDVELTLSNKIVAKLCRSVTTSFQYRSPPFGSSINAAQIETPCRVVGGQLPSREEACRFFGIDASRKTIFILGGGTGALAINHALEDVLDEILTHCDVIHSAGIGKSIKHLERTGYHAFELMNEDQVRHAYAVADVVVSRAGLGTLSELAALKKAAIVIPIPNSHQEANARALEKGIVWLHQTQTGFSDALRTVILDLLKDESRQKTLGYQLHESLPTDDGSALAERWMKLISK